LLAKVPSGVIKGLAHITGGGLIDNLPRILPNNCNAVIDTKSWRVPRIFQTLQQKGNVDAEEMYQVFNMGIGMVVIVSEHDAKRTMSILRGKQIGRLERGAGKAHLVFCWGNTVRHTHLFRGRDRRVRATRMTAVKIRSGRNCSGVALLKGEYVGFSRPPRRHRINY